MSARIRDVMVDIETLGTRPGSVILSIGAFAFDATDRSVINPFYTVISTASCEAAGLTRDADTVAWWSRQDDQARRVLDEAASETRRDLPWALTQFGEYLSKYGGPRDVRLWGNGSDFDNVLIHSAYQAVGIAAPWRFHNNRCYRTLKGLRPDIVIVREGTHHNALDDAGSQAEHACRLLTALRTGGAA